MVYAVVRLAGHVWNPWGMRIGKAGWNSWAYTEVKVPQNFLFRETSVLLLKPLLIESGPPDELPYLKSLNMDFKHITKDPHNNT